MANASLRIPKYRLHKARNLARVTSCVEVVVASSPSFTRRRRLFLSIRPPPLGFISRHPPELGRLSASPSPCGHAQDTPRWSRQVFYPAGASIELRLRRSSWSKADNRLHASRSRSTPTCKRITKSGVEDQNRQKEMIQHPGWLLVVAGLIAVGVGVVWLLAPSIPWLGKLPGDISVERENFRFYFPVVTCIVISLVLTGIMWLVRFLSK